MVFSECSQNVLRVFLECPQTYLQVIDINLKQNPLRV
jgi:hypothetical protein